MSLPLEQQPARPVSTIRIYIVIVILVAAAVAGGAWGISERSEQHQRLIVRAQERAIPTVLVVAPARPSESVTRIELPGRVEPQTRAPIYSRIAGYLKSWHVDIGQSVKAGQLLADIETPELDQQLAQAQAELASVTANAGLSRATAERWQTLRDQGFVSSQAVEEKRGDLKVKQAQVMASQANLDRLTAQKRFARIVAPFDGVITARNTDVGALVVAGGASNTELFTLSNVSSVRIYVNVPQNRALAIRRGDKASFTVPEQPGKRWAATVLATSQAIGPGSGSMLVQLTADNADAKVLAGGFARISFELPREAALTVPAGAMIFGSAGPRVATVDAEDRVRIRRVSIAKDHGTVVELLEGVQPGDRIILSPPDGILEGDKVKPRTQTAPGQIGERRTGS
jgi:RND family efflux transporter MFP subunit